jgi:predicted ATPase
LREEVRLISLLGPGGIGKTRLSIELARRLSGSFANNIAFVDLSSLRSPDQVGTAIAQSLGLKETEEAHLKTYLRPRSFLLVLDNFEHLLPAKSLVVDLLATAPRLKILVTSRTVLHVYGEHEFIVSPLAIPSMEKTKDPLLSAQFPAVNLFVQRAQSVNPTFTLTTENAEAVAELCVRMEGNPLAIELAAFQIKYFSPQAMLVRLANSKRLAFLSHVSKRLPLHQQTIRDMLDWSFILLSSPLQTLFSRLAVFSGGCTFDAAENVCSDLSGADSTSVLGGNLIAGYPYSIQEGLTSLADQSLLRQVIDADGEPRFSMPGMTREYAQEQLEKIGGTSSLQHAHARYYLKLVEEVEIRLDSSSRQAPFNLLNREYANLEAAMQWTLDQHEGEMGLRFTAALWDFWQVEGSQSKGNDLAQTILEQTVGLKLPIRARVMRLFGWQSQDYRDLTSMLWAFQSSLDLSNEIGDSMGVSMARLGLGELARLRSQFAQARLYLQQSLELFTERQDNQQIAWAYDLMGRIELSTGNLTAARSCFQKSLDLFQKRGSNSGMITALCHLGQACYYEGDLEQAKTCFEESQGLCRGVGNPCSTASAQALNYLGEIAGSQSQPRLARELVDQCLHLSKSMGYSWCTELGCFTSGMQALKAGEIESAAFYLRESVLLQQSLKEDWRVLILLEAVAFLAIQHHDPLGAARLYGIVDRLRHDLQIVQFPIYRQQYDTGLEQLKQQLNPEALEEIWNAGLSLSLDQALVYTLRCLE